MLTVPSLLYVVFAKHSLYQVNRGPHHPLTESCTISHCGMRYFHFSLDLPTSANAQEKQSYNRQNEVLLICMILVHDMFEDMCCGWITSGMSVNMLIHLLLDWGCERNYTHHKCLDYLVTVLWTSVYLWLLRQVTFMLLLQMCYFFVSRPTANANCKWWKTSERVNGICSVNYSIQAALLSHMKASQENFTRLSLSLSVETS